MRLTGAAFLLSMLLFNWFGYRLVIGMLETEANSTLEAQFDQNRYDESQLITIKVPVRYLPYYANSTEFQRVNGQIEIGGVQYKYVKRRIYHDSLELRCFPNNTVMNLRTAENEFFTFSNELAPVKKPGALPNAKKFFSLYKYIVQSSMPLTIPVRIVTPPAEYTAYPTPLRPHSTAEQPPETV